jgi:hypothetical protein
VTNSDYLGGWNADNPCRCLSVRCTPIFPDSLRIPHHMVVSGFRSEWILWLKLHYQDTTFGMKLWYQGVYRDEDMLLLLGTKETLWCVLISKMAVTPDDNLMAGCVEMPANCYGRPED